MCKIQPSFSEILRNTFFLMTRHYCLLWVIPWLPPSFSQKTNKSLHWTGATLCYCFKSALHCLLLHICFSDVELRQRRRVGGMSRKWGNNKGEIRLEEIPGVLEETMGKILIKPNGLAPVRLANKPWTLMLLSRQEKERVQVAVAGNECLIMRETKVLLDEMWFGKNLGWRNSPKATS